MWVGCHSIIAVVLFYRAEQAAAVDEMRSGPKPMRSTATKMAAACTCRSPPPATAGEEAGRRHRSSSRRRSNYYCRFRFRLANACATELRICRISGERGEGIFPVFVANPRTVRSYRKAARLSPSPVGIIGVTGLGGSWLGVRCHPVAQNDCTFGVIGVEPQYVRNTPLPMPHGKATAAPIRMGFGGAASLVSPGLPCIPMDLTVASVAGSRIVVQPVRALAALRS